ncbi:SusC/RagA family TonB-linked outer membrane protein [Chitinophaga qingshengii]|uniref:SusC/RagA family TonB-linked outer membrane protein n=1 Tax=Chitinophaga qingshengii TaxID=1569794 RepID=A0ABR7TNJ5_9BACT|nr:SusC/RagA family TonB-linked outer membrane protein [Chitinophaga qingshengii]MBC9931210.1 SusC/RagA family TonB-linked outer membrane protein [Chitinophaga qingshengii]
MKLTVMLLLAALMQVSASSFAQTVTLSVKKAPLNSVFREMQQQTGYSFLYSKEDLQQTSHVSLDVKNAPLATALQQCFKDQPLTFTIVDKVVIIKREKTATAAPLAVETIAALPITGTVTDSAGTPLPGASIVIKGTTKSTISDVDGRFNIDAKPGEVLVIRYVGFNNQEITIGKSSSIQVKLEQLSNRLTGISVVSTGYQTISKERAPGSYATISADDMKGRMQTGILDRIEGMAAGMTSYKGKQQIRGVSTLSSQTAPLYVIDGMPFEGDSAVINPSDIATITVLKDATAASIYGARAANGVIVMTTKQGKPGAMRVSYNNSFKFTPLPSRGYSNLMSSAELVDFQREMFNYRSNDYNSINPRKGMNDVYRLLYERKGNKITEDQLQDALNVYRNNDRYRQMKDELLRQAAMTQQHSLAFSGGSEKYRYNLSVNYLGTSPYEKNQQSQRFGYNLRNSFNFTKWMRVDVGVLGSSIKEDYDNGFLGMDNYNRGKASYYMLRDPNGQPAQWYLTKSQFEIDRLNSLGLQDETYRPLEEVNRQHYTRKGNYLNLNIGANFRIANGLTLDVRYQAERMDTTIQQLYRKNANVVTKMINDATPQGSALSPIPLGGQFDEWRTSANTNMLRLQLNYNKLIGEDHEIQALAGAERRQVRRTATNIYKYGYDEFSLNYKPLNERDLVLLQRGVEAVDDVFYLDRKEKGFRDQEDRFVSFYGNGSYTYKRKLTASGSIRMDQSNLFGTDPKYQYKPMWSAGLLYVITDGEDISWLDRLAVRTTYGINANIPKDAGPYMITMDNGNNNLTNESQAYVYSPPNAGLRWEKTKVTNIGIDFSTFSGKLTGSVDFYNKNTSDLLGRMKADPTTGWSYYVVNYGSMYNRGVDLTLTSTNVNTKDFRWNTTFNFNYNKNELTRLDVSDNSMYGYVYDIQRRRGVPMDALYSVRYAGLDATGKPQAYTKDGKIVKSLADLSISDLVYSGTTVPPYSASLQNTLRYKDFDLFFMFIYYGGNVMRDVVAPYLTKFPELNYTSNMDRLALNYWKKPGDEQNPDIAPGYLSSASTNFTALWDAADTHVSKASYIKLRDVTLSYNLPASLLKKAFIQSMRVSFQVQNLWRWSANEQNLDPEVWAGNKFGAFTRGQLIPPSYTIGVNVNF